MGAVTSTQHTQGERGPSRLWILALVLGTIGIAIGWYGPIQILLPAQAEALAPASRESLLALVTGVGAAASMIANPLWGALSDRFRVRRGTRMPVVVIGGAVGVVGLFVLSAASAPLTMTIGWVLVQAGLNGPFAVLAALIADRVPEERRGVVGSWFGVGQLIGTVVGTLLAVVVGEGMLGYLAVAVAVPLLLLPILLFPTRSQPSAVQEEPAPRLSVRAVRVTRRFAAAFGVRMLMNLVSAMGTLYLYFYLSARAGMSDPASWVLVLTVIYVGVAAVTAAVGGSVADRTRARRTVAVCAAIVLAVAAVILAFADGIGTVVTAVVAFGLGYGLYLAVDIAIVTDALPDPRTRATYLGVANIASSLPQVLAPVITAPIVVSAGGYLALYLATAVVALIALPLLPFVGQHTTTKAPAV